MDDRHAGDDFVPGLVPIVPIPILVQVLALAQDSDPLALTHVRCLGSQQSQNDSHLLVHGHLQTAAH